MNLDNRAESGWRWGGEASCFGWVSLKAEGDISHPNYHSAVRHLEHSKWVANIAFLAF